MIRRWIDLRAVLLAVALSAAAALPVMTTSTDRRDFYFFDLTLTSSAAGSTQLFWDLGRGFNEHDSSRQPLKIEPAPVVYRYMMPMGAFRGLRLDPVDGRGEMIIGHARIVDFRGRVVREFPPEDFQPFRQIEHVEGRREWLYLRTTPEAKDPILLIPLHEPLTLEPDAHIWFILGWPTFWKVLLAALVVGLTPIAGRCVGLARRVGNAAQRRPGRAIAGAALLAVAIQAHPVIFFGRSYVSPDNGGHMLYEDRPTVPGNQPSLPVDTMGSDTGALLFQHLYYPMVQRDALAHGEWPLWNRYSLAGVPLLGQGQSMFGDPFNFLTIATDSAAWAWDLRFVVARWLFAAGLGLVVWRLAGHLGAALLVTIASAFIGFSSYRLAHPANFSVCYAPWILWAWTRLIDARSPRQETIALAALVLVNWTVLTSGTVKEAYMLLVGLNFAGALLALLHPANRPRRWRVLTLASAAGAGFVLLTAPLWLSFVVALRHSFTSYDQPTAFPLPLPHFIGFFEDLFHRQTTPQENVAAPALNLFFLLPVLWWLVQPRLWRSDRLGLALVLAALPAFALAYGLVPVPVILRLPVIQSISHVGNTFSCVLLVLVAVLAGLALRDALTRLREPGWARTCGLMALGGGALAAAYFLTTRGVPKSPFFLGYLPGVVAASIALPFAARRFARDPARPAPLVVALALGLPLLFWRHGQQLGTVFHHYAYSPGARVDFHAPSPAAALVDAHRREQPPGRVVGWGNTLYAAYNTLLRWEGLYGVDALRNRHFHELAAAFDLKRVWIWDGVNADAEAGRLVPAHDVLNVTHYVASRREPPRATHTLVHLGARDLDVYHSPDAWPRAFFTDRLARYAQPAEFVDRVLQGERRPFAAMQAGDSIPLELPANLDGRAIVAARDYRLTPNSTQFVVEAPAAGIVVLTEAWYERDFQVTVNGAPAPYFRVNHAFKGVALPAAGRYTIRFEYWPQHFTVALWAGLAGLVLLPLAGLWWCRRPAGTAG